MPSDINTFTSITRRIYSGFSGFAATDISDNDPCWHQKVLGKTPATAYWCWNHEHHIDSPWRLPFEVFLQWLNSVQWIPTESPFDTMLHWNIDSIKGGNYSQVMGLPRFDYADGYCVKPKMDGRNLDEVKSLSAQFTSVPTSFGYKYDQDILPCNRFKCLYYNMVKFGTATTINEGQLSHAISNPINPDASMQKQNGIIGDRNYQNNYIDVPQKYFENNVMRPILYKGCKIAFTGGNMLVEFDYEIRIRHTIKVRYGDRDGMPENQYRQFQKAVTKGVPLFNAYYFLRDKSKTINYFLGVVHNNIGRTSQQDVQSYFHKTYYVPAIFPLCQLDNV